MGELVAQSGWQLSPTEGGLAYATVVARVASPQQPSGPHKSTANGTVPNEPAASFEAAAERVSLRDMSGPLCGMPDGTTTYAQVASNSATPAVERQNKDPIYVKGVTDTRGCLTWLQASCQIVLSAQIKGEKPVRFGYMQRYSDYALRCVACGEAHVSEECSTSQQQFKCCSCGRNHTAY